MGEVYRATDTTLGRQVAIKILPDAFASDPERLARFEREAKTLASLNHPHIAAIYGFEKSAGMHALVMELVEGPTTRRPHRPGAISARRSLVHCEADRRGPRSRARAGHHSSRPEAREHQGARRRHGEGARLRPRESDGARRGVLSPSMSMSPTITTPAMTQAGMILGTAAYMSPEQARGTSGGQARRRVGLWRGAVGDADREAPVRGRDRLGHARGGAEDGAAVERARARDARSHSPSPAPLPGEGSQAPPRFGCGRATGDRGSIDSAVGPRGCRLAGDIIGAARTPGWMVAFAVAAVLAAALAIPAVRYLRETPPPEPVVTRLDVVTPPTSDAFSFALSHDGRQLAFVANGEKGSQLWLRPLDQVKAQPLAGTEGASYPFWAPGWPRDRLFCRRQIEADRSRPEAQYRCWPMRPWVVAAHGTRTVSSCSRRRPLTHFCAWRRQAGRLRR